jgi:hypothetical protein
MRLLRRNGPRAQRPHAITMAQRALLRRPLESAYSGVSSARKRTGGPFRSTPAAISGCARGHAWVGVATEPSRPNARDQGEHRVRFVSRLTAIAGAPAVAAPMLYWT